MFARFRVFGEKISQKTFTSALIALISLGAARSECGVLPQLLGRFFVSDGLQGLSSSRAGMTGLGD